MQIIKNLNDFEALPPVTALTALTVKRILCLIRLAHLQLPVLPAASELLYLLNMYLSSVLFQFFLIILRTKKYEKYLGNILLLRCCPAAQVSQYAASAGIVLVERMEYSGIVSTQNAGQDLRRSLPKPNIYFSSFSYPCIVGIGQSETKFPNNHWHGGNKTEVSELLTIHSIRKMFGKLIIFVYPYIHMSTSQEEPPTQPPLFCSRVSEYDPW